jgi:uncharacterized DUF497 family protein
MRFEWDSEKNTANLVKHGVNFREAATVFGDPLSLAIPDSGHSISENRYIIIGESIRGRLLVVAHTERAEAIRIMNEPRSIAPRYRSSARKLIVGGSIPGSSYARKSAVELRGMDPRANQFQRGGCSGEETL